MPYRPVQSFLKDPFSLRDLIYIPRTSNRGGSPGAGTLHTQQIKFLSNYEQATDIQALPPSTRSNQFLNFLQKFTFAQIIKSLDEGEKGGSLFYTGATRGGSANNMEEETNATTMDGLVNAMAEMTTTMATALTDRPWLSRSFPPPPCCWLNPRVWLPCRRGSLPSPPRPAT